MISEHVDGAWIPLSSRLDETGHLVTRLLGMNLAQFTQVAMLPQGRFQAFLRARSDDRHRLLQQLFRTGRFEQVEPLAARPPARPESAQPGPERTVAALVTGSARPPASTAPPDESAARVERPAGVGGARPRGRARRPSWSPCARPSVRPGRPSRRAGSPLGCRPARRRRPRTSRALARSDEITALRTRVVDAVPGPRRHAAPPGRRGRPSRLRRRGAPYRAGAVRVGAPRRPPAEVLRAVALPALVAQAADAAASARLLPRERERATWPLGSRGAGRARTRRPRPRTAPAAGPRRDHPPPGRSRGPRRRRTTGGRVPLAAAVRNDLVAAQLDLNRWSQVASGWSRSS